MNIKSFLGINTLTSPVGQVGKVERLIKSESSQDRDANGQYFNQQKKRRDKMSDEQFQKALGILREKSFMKEMNWVVSIFEDNQHKYAWVQDLNGATIRKISEFDLWELFEEDTQPSSKGQLLKKTA